MRTKKLELHFTEKDVYYILKEEQSVEHQYSLE